MITDMPVVKINIQLICSFEFKHNLNNSSVVCTSNNMNYVKYVTGIDIWLIILFQINHD